MKNGISLVLKQVGKLADKTLELSANTTSTWIAHQSKIPNGVKKFKKIQY